MKKLKTAVIGAGNMGKNHIRVYSEISNLTAIADPIIEIGEPVSKEYNLKYYRDYKEMLEKEKPDAVSVVVPTRFHKDVTIECLQRKIPTLVEKPISETIEEAQEMLKLAKSQNVFLMVGHVERFNPAIIQLKKLVEKKRFGEIINLLAIRVGIAPPKIKNSDVVLDLAIHDIDIFSYLLEKQPLQKNIMKKKIFNTNSADMATIVLSYKEITGIINTNWITPVKMRKLYLTGTEGFAEVDYIKQSVKIHDKAIVTKQLGDYLEFLSISNSPKKEIYISKKEPLRVELQYFLSHAKKGADNSLAEEAMNALKIIL